MSVLILLIVALVVIGLLVYAEGLLPFDRRIVQLLQAATILLGAVVILQRLGFV